MNAKERRVFRRTVDRTYPPGSFVVVDYEGPIGFGVVMPKARRSVKIAVIRTRSVFERVEYNRVMVESTPSRFGHISLHWTRVSPAPQGVINKYLGDLAVAQNDF